MSDIGQVVDYPLPVISTGSGESLGLEITNLVGSLGTGTAAAWPSANLAIFIPIRIGAIYTAVKMFWINGATVGTNSVDVGIYDNQGNRLVSQGSTLTAGANAVQIVDIADTVLAPGLYFMGMAMNGTTDTVARSAMLATDWASFGVMSQVTAFPLPNPTTIISTTTAYIPFIAITSNTVV